ncbi:hypothetical protein [Crocosphaera chwakensis]|uniref:Uncharacterized protein n=1 Tax=Crocosphaera chwakensis CCY0110 TaxID=391612 RepID=A3IZE5_9CHRO|nr:hypothetical protein [Crocosphaera chwakensis]EAZ88157.1 hypothetical protein CY0110_14775 [Crocosphaera chwakensis CCY0110]
MSQQIPFLNLEDLKTIDFSEKALVKTTGEDYCLSVSDVIDKLGEESEDINNILRLLGEETILCRLFKLKEEVYCGVPKIYRDESNKVKLYDAQNNPQPIDKEIQFIEYETDYAKQLDDSFIFTGYQTIAIKEGDLTAALKVSTGIFKEWQTTITEQYKKDSSQVKMPQGKGTIPPQIINFYPRSIVPMSSLEVGQSLIVQENLGLDPRQPGATRFQVQEFNLDINQPVGEVFEVWANYQLRKHYQQYGQTPCTVVDKDKKGDKTILKFARADFAKVS